MARVWMLEPNSEFESWFYHLLVMWVGENQLTTLCLTFVNCKIGIIVTPRSTGVFVVNLMHLYHPWGLLCIEVPLLEYPCMYGFGYNPPRRGICVRFSWQKRSGYYVLKEAVTSRCEGKRMWGSNCEVQVSLPRITFLWAAGQDR